MLEIRVKVSGTRMKSFSIYNIFEVFGDINLSNYIYKLTKYEIIIIKIGRIQKPKYWRLNNSWSMYSIEMSNSIGESGGQIYTYFNF